MRDYLNSIRRPLPAGPQPPTIGHNGGPPMDPRLPPRHPLEVLVENGTVVGHRAKGAGTDIQTLPLAEFEWRVSELTRSVDGYEPSNSYDGIFYDLSDRCVVGLRMSLRNGLTLDLIDIGNITAVDYKYKFHH